MPVRPPRVYIRRYNTTQVRIEAPATSYKARDGEMFFDPETRTLRLGNGSASGGVILAGPSGDVSSQLVNDLATFSLQADGDVVLEGTLRDTQGNDLLAGLGGGTDTANFAFDTTGDYNTLYMADNANNSFMSLSPSGSEGQAYINIPGDNYAGNGLGIYNSNSNGRVLIQTGSNVEISAANSNPNGRFIVSVSGNQTSFETDGSIRLVDSGRITRTPYPTGSASVSTNSYADPYADPVASGMTDLNLQADEYDYDDDSYSLQLPWNIKVFGRKVSNVTISSNAYIVFEKSVNNADYIPSPGNAADMVESVPQPFLCIYGRDGGWHKVWTKNEGSSFVIRFTGDPFHNGWTDPDTLIYNVRFYENSDQIDVTCVANSGEPSLAFVSDSWSNVLSFDNAQGNAYALRTSPYMYDVNGNIKIHTGGDITAEVDEDLYLKISDAADDGYSLGMIVDDGAGTNLSRAYLNRDEFRINVNMTGSSPTWTFDNNGHLKTAGDVWRYDGSIALYAMDTGSSSTSASIQSRSHLNDGVFTTIVADTGGANINTNLTDTSRHWNFGSDGNLQLPNGNVIGGKEIPVVSGNTTSITSYAYDASGTTVMLALGDTVDFPNFSGIVTANCYASGTVTQFMCGGGGGSGIVVGSSKVTDTGTMVDNGGINGYTFTATETGEHCFYVVRTRTGA